METREKFSRKIFDKKFFDKNSKLSIHVKMSKLLIKKKKTFRRSLNCQIARNCTLRRYILNFLENNKIILVEAKL